MKNFFLKTGLTLLCLLIGLGSAWGDTATLTFSAACGGSGTDSQGNTWTVTSDADESTYDGTKGIHYGTGKKAVSHLTLTCSAITGNITKIVVNASGASGTSAKLSATVGGNDFGTQKQSLTASNAAYTFSGSASGEIEIKASQTSATKALYVKSIEVTYSSGTTKTLSSIAVKNAPTKTTYTEGETFDPAGLVITAQYSNADPEDIAYADHASDFTFSPELTTELTPSNTSVTITYGGKTTTQSITVNEAPKHTAHFSINGTIDNTKDCTVAEGAAITLPSDLDDINGKKFMGWVSSPIDGTTNEAPDFVTSATMGTSDVTYYAVYATASGSEQTYHLTQNEIKASTAHNSYSDITVYSASGTWTGKAIVNTATGYIQINKNTSNYNLCTPEFSAPISKIDIYTTYNTPSGRTFYLRGDNATAQPTSSTIGSASLSEASGSVSIDVKSSLPLNQLYIYSSGAVYISNIDVTCGSASYSGFCTTVDTSTPSISADNVNIAADATYGEIEYSITNAVTGKSLSATTTADWISDIQVSADEVTFTTTANTASTERIAEITLTYDGATDKVVTITQAGATPVYASLAALVADGAPTATAKKVTVTLTDEEITAMTNSSITLTSGTQNVQIYCSDRPSGWAIGGTVSGTLTECDWGLYNNSVWELTPDNWNDLTYTAPTQEVPEYASLAELIDAGAPTTSGKTITVTLTNETITRKVSNGIFVQVGDKEIELYKTGLPSSWQVGGTISGTLTNCTWQDYYGTWELCPTSWDELSYTAPLPNIPNFIKTASAAVKTNELIDIREYLNLPTDVTYGGYDIITSIGGATESDGKFACAYDIVEFSAAGTYVVDVTAVAKTGYYAETTGKVTFTVTSSSATLENITIEGTPTKTTYTVGESFSCDGLTVTAHYSENTEVDVTSEAEWVANPATITDGTTKVTVTATYCGMTDTKEYDVTVNADYATLPFEWAGGVSADFTALNGVTASGLGSDYAASNAPYRIKLDNTEDYFQVKTNEAIGICTVGVKMIGGATASSIKVQGSADGESFTDVETLTISGKQNDVLSLSTTSNLDESYRYVRFVFTKGSNVGLGPIKIAKPDNRPTYTVSVASNIEHGTVATSANSAKENDEITVTVSPDTHYHLATLYYTEEGDATQNPITATDDEYSFTMPATNVTVSATFEEDAKYTIAWSVNGTIVQTEKLYKGEVITHVDPESTTFTDAVPTGVTKVFTGWVTTPTVDADSEPSYVTPATTATEDVTYYAVFATESGSGSGTGSVTEELTTDEIVELGPLAYATEKGYTDGTVDYLIHAYKDNDARPWAQLKKDTGSYIKIMAPSAITNVTITITSGQNSSGGINDITKHTAFSGKVGLTTSDCDFTTSSENVASATDIQDNTAVLEPTGTNTELYLKVSIGARIWDISVTYGGGTGTTYSDFTTQLFLTTITVSKYGSTTLSLDKDYTMPEGLTGKIITAKKHKENEGDGYYTLTYVTKYNAGDVVPAGEALVIQDGFTLDESRDYRVYEGTATGEVTSYPDNLLCAEYTEDANGKWLTSFNNGVDNYYYKLTTKNGANFGWYYGDTDGKPFLMSREDRAYLVIAKQIAAGIRGFALEDGEEEDLTTGIDNMETNSTNSIYNLQGLQQSKLQKGINIVNGKKVIR